MHNEFLLKMLQKSEKKLVLIFNLPVDQTVGKD